MHEFILRGREGENVFCCKYMRLLLSITDSPVTIVLDELQRRNEEEEKNWETHLLSYSPIIVHILFQLKWYTKGIDFLYLKQRWTNTTYEAKNMSEFKRNVELNLVMLKWTERSIRSQSDNKFVPAHVNID